MDKFTAHKFQSPRLCRVLLTPRRCALRNKWFLLAAACLFLPASARALCYGDNPWNNVPTYHVCGSVSKITATGWQPGGQSYVKICRAGYTSGCSTTVTTPYADGWGQTVYAFKFSNYRQGSTGYVDFDFYAWGYTSTSYWGSSSKPVRRISIGPNGLHGISVGMPPRPLDPTPLYPAGMSVPNAYTVTWKSGIDADRKFYPATWEVWYKYWPFGGEEPSSWTLSRADMPCHDDGSGPDSSGQCSTYVAGPQPAGNWQWMVVANLNVSSVVYYPNTIFKTESGAMQFVQPE